MSDIRDQVLQSAAAAGNTGMAAAARKAAERNAAKTATKAGGKPAPAAPKPTAQAQTADAKAHALVESGSALLGNDEIARVLAAYQESEEQRQREQDAERKCLDQLRAIHVQYRVLLRDRKWCQTHPDGVRISRQIEQLHATIDQLDGLSPTDPDAALMRKIRTGWTMGDLVYCMREATKPLNDGIEPILREVSAAERKRMIDEGTLAKLFFRVDGKIWFPNGYEGRREVRRVTHSLIRLRARAGETMDQERRRQQELLRDHPASAIDLGQAFGLARADQVSEPTGVALFIRKIVFQAPGKTDTRPWSGVVHVRIEPTDAKPGVPGKRIAVVEAVGDIQRILPAQSIWLLALQDARPNVSGSRQQVLESRMPHALIAWVEQRVAEFEAKGVQVAKALAAAEAKAPSDEQLASAQAELAQLDQRFDAKSFADKAEREAAIERSRELRTILRAPRDIEALRAYSIDDIAGLPAWKRAEAEREQHRRPQHHRKGGQRGGKGKPKAGGNGAPK